MKYAALLRGINVGGNNIIKMSELRSCFEDLGFANVDTYIQSGNVIFETRARKVENVYKKIAKGLAKCFDYEGVVVLVSQGQMERIVKRAPKEFAKDKLTLRCDVMFLAPGLVPGRIVHSIPNNPSVDRVWKGPRCVYFARDHKDASKSRLSRITQMPIYQQMTIRNWRTTQTLLEMMED